jgi:hypothetical protein
VKTRKTDDDVIVRLRRTYAAVAQSTVVGAGSTRPLAVVAVGAPLRSRRRRVLVVAAAAALVSIAAVIGMLAVRDGGMGSSEPKIRTPAGPDVVLPDSALAISDEVVLDLVAPVSYVSRRNAADLELAIARRQYEQTTACVEAQLGFESPAFQADHTRFFAFPDPDELRAEGFHHPSEASVEQPISTPEGFDDAVTACYERYVQESGFDSLQDGLSAAWAPVQVAALERPEEGIEWQLAAECLRDRGYADEELESEMLFLGIGDRIGQDASLSDAEKEARDVQLGNDYVDCADNVWAARAAHLLEQRTAWAMSHAGELEALTEQLRTAFTAGG